MNFIYGEFSWQKVCLFSSRCYWIRYRYLEEKLAKGSVWNLNGRIYLILIISSIAFHWSLRSSVSDVCLFHGSRIYFDVLLLRHVSLNIFVVRIFWSSNSNAVLFFVSVECFFSSSVSKPKTKGIAPANILERRKTPLSAIKSSN